MHTQVKIPITKNLSIDVRDPVGTMELSQEMADFMAECYTRNLCFKVDACVEINVETNDGKPLLKHVSVTAIPADPKVA